LRKNELKRRVETRGKKKLVKENAVSSRQQRRGQRKGPVHGKGRNIFVVIFRRPEDRSKKTKFLHKSRGGKEELLERYRLTKWMGKFSHQVEINRPERS